MRCWKRGRSGRGWWQPLTKTRGDPEETFRKLINAPRNFIKHADRDPDASFEEMTLKHVDTVVMIACMDYMVLSGRQPLMVDFFATWYSALYPADTGDLYRAPADRIFPGLAKMDRATQLMAARFPEGNEVNTAPDFQATRSEMTDNYRWTKLRKWSRTSEN